ncbi:MULTISPECIES: cysteine desulfurase family protein [Prochlorococcus]|uniref:cysteine desulfurase n=1 Tax=Prochlorococcus marinus (strain SARG / CCMP1375 / SS120) TaxID=167539 RepID=Q7VE19_PROMA|nr:MULTISPECIES: cysteine desulfurase family protein [Prochlorococcus]AAP99241.1 Cysteine desulfurase [Prochlorococcus marinus subsp. marinus str. CCMP1375]KGG18556.1 Cysteine desulfurase [Prochlorococcus marinus str. SS2]KGG32705.1 Cysteine desulfurase [Prochlorococcus marinus str. SS51]
MKTTPLYFDYQSTTPCLDKVVDAMVPYWSEFWGNPSSRQNRLGLHASAAISLARDKLGSLLQVSPQRLIFTSGATEANNLALLGYSRAKAQETGSTGHLITISTEHRSVIEPLRQLRREGFRVTELTPNVDGIISLDGLSKSFEDDTFLVSVMLANNEIGVLQPIKEIASLCKSRGVIFHSDASQGFGNLPIEIDKLQVDFLSISGHKIYGPKGIGLLVLGSNSIKIKPLQWGGDQENGIRAGTLPVPLVIGMAKAAEIAIEEIDLQVPRIRKLRDKLWQGLRDEIPELMLNGSFDKRLPNNLNFTVIGVNGSRLHKKLRPLISCSSGSACSNGSPSHVLMSLGRTINEAEASLRLSLGRATTLNDVEMAIDIISNTVNYLRK